MSNRENRVVQDSVHVLLAMARPCHGEKSACIRSVDKGRGDEIEMLESKLKVIGGYWRIHRTVNARDCEKARKWLICQLIHHPEKACYVDSEWRTALLQPEHISGAKKFMLDIDTQEKECIDKIESLISEHLYDPKSGYERESLVLERIKTPKGWHYITYPFDTRKVCELPYVTLIRDGYYFIKEVGERKI